MKTEWIQKYREIAEKNFENHVDVLTGFNANIDISYDVEDLDIDLDVEAEKMDVIRDEEDFRKMLKYTIEKGVNKEVDRNGFEPEFRSGEQQLGGQAGIMANYLSSFHNSVTFYTPFLSEDLAELISKKVLYPVYEGRFLLKNVRDSANTDRTKKNLIFEFEGDKTGRLILSDKVRGFGPYFRKGVEDNLDLMDEDLDRILLSGFQNTQGNLEAKFKKAEGQLEKIKTPIHLEYVDMDRKTLELVEKYVLPHVDSLGCDEYELKSIEDKLDLDVTENEAISLGEAFTASKKLIEEYGLSRVHIHTYRFHSVVVDDDYPIETERIRDAMMWGELSAIQMAETGRLPNLEDVRDFEMEDKHLKRLDELEHFEDFFDLENFAREGTAEVEGYRVAAIPAIIHEEPERLVGMGDVISSGTFVWELK
jgi:ADP-dependent phosphofructokinase/glucokinase